MPLIQITTQFWLHPLGGQNVGTPAKKMTADFASALPGLFVANAKKLHLQANTPEAGVQVTHKKFHGRDVNIPDMWVVVQFSEAGLTKKQQLKVTAHVKKLVFGWFEDNDLSVPGNFAVDCFWGPSHGFLRINGTITEW